jgi:hypothetical protein
MWRRAENQARLFQGKAATTTADIVDHPPNAHDDLINGAAGALCLANLVPMPLRPDLCRLVRGNEASHVVDEVRHSGDYAELDGSERCG